MTSPDLSKLLQRVSEGDDLAFKSLFNTYRPNVYTTVLRFTNDTCMAEDIVQDTFVKLWLNRARLPGLDNFDRWLYVLSKNITLDILKKAKNYKTYYQEETKDALLRFFPASDYLIQDKEFQDLLQKAIDRLPPKQQQTYRLAKEQFLKREEIARELNVSPETVKWNLEQAMKSIRAYCVASISDIPFVLVLHFLTRNF